MQDCERNRRRNYMRHIAQLHTLADVLQITPQQVAVYLTRLKEINRRKEAEALIYSSKDKST